MNAVHLQTRGMHCAACPPRIEAILGCLPGVRRVVASRSLGVTSVLFDEQVVDVGAIRERISRAGFDADVRPGSKLS